MKELSLLEMRDKRGLLIEDNQEITAKIKKEKREMTPEEQTSFDANEKLAKELEDAILLEEEKRNVDPEQIKKVPKMSSKPERFSLFRAINDEINRRPQSDLTTAISNEGRAEFAKSKLSAEGSIVLPTETRSAMVAGASSTTAGGYIVATDTYAVLPPLTNYLVLTQAGASYLTGLVGNVSIPTYSGTTVAWKAETAAAADGAGTWGQVNLVPRRLSAYIDVSKMFLLQDSVGAEAMLLSNLAKAIAVKLESTILGVGEGGSTSESAPQGLFWSQYTAGATTFSWANIVGLETTVDSSNALINNLAYITNAAGRGAAKTTVRTATYGEQMIMEGTTINGYPVYVTNGVPKTTDFSTTTGYGFIFGNWADLLIGQWGGYDLIVDPYTVAVNGEVRIVVNCYFDAAAARSASFKALHMA